MGAPVQPSTKAAAAAPKLNSEMEMGSMPVEEEAQSPKQDDIMQLARLGDVPAMERLFETGGFDATFTDDEGITPLHVSRALYMPSAAASSVSDPALTCNSGRLSIISTPCASSSSSTVPRSTRRAESL